MMRWSLRKKRGHFLYRLFCPKKTFPTFVFYLNVYYIEYAFRIFILLYIKKHYFIHFFCLFWKSRKAFSVSLSEVGVLLLEIFGCRPEIYWKMAVPNAFSNTFWIFFWKEFKFLPQAKTNSEMKIKKFHPWYWTTQFNKVNYEDIWTTSKTPFWYLCFNFGHMNT